ncbi:hypothetical protein [Nostoc sp. ChiVER01]|uniref:hypothetical protein n=1 Tax=Nostoc sp. ChiVER01 TaxID=3075382 RepID=UPI002AD321AA|nr:hypothetical protein [Nostoc sp. ChiVER01]MDZ8227095.1 hypothetical protein [Nostoc sp. ChiVER01]
MIARRFCTQSAAAGLGAARCNNFQLQLTTSPASWWKLEVKTGSYIYSIAIAVERACTSLRFR